MMSSAWMCAAMLASCCLLSSGAAMPARRSPAPDLAARRRSATDRTFIRFGRSPYPEMTAADLREELKHQRFTRARQDNIIRLGRSDSFLRFGRSQPLRLSEEELLDLIRPYDDDYEGYRSAKRRANNFVRLGRRDNNFLRLGRAIEDYPGFEVNGELMVTHKEPKFKKDSYLRLGRSGEMETSEGLNEMFDEEEQAGDRKKRSLEQCSDCLE